LKALGCPFSADFNISNREHIVTLVRWLEDRKIREYDIQERTCLQDSPSWETHFNLYLERLQCPFRFIVGTSTDSIAWLVAYAVSLDYDDSEFDATTTKHVTSSGYDIYNKLDQTGLLLNVLRASGESNTGSDHSTILHLT
jgi:hypothetical protein